MFSSSEIVPTIRYFDLELERKHKWSVQEVRAVTCAHYWVVHCRQRVSGRDVVVQIRRSCPTNMSTAAIEAGVEGFEFVKPKVVEKVFNLPVVTDTYDSLTKLSTPLHPYMEKASSIASPVATIRYGVCRAMPQTIPSTTT